MPRRQVLLGSREHCLPLNRNLTNSVKTEPNVVSLYLEEEEGFYLLLTVRLIVIAR